ncbi:MAG: transporter substrate-binding domain-containing protein [gamma proteobacterium symbiont of Taylorina sp.]|nr:transporter substrate-binding domain-containing protein [gamma proteobacterium symbiont of Taylorina sp.]
MTYYKLFIVLFSLLLLSLLTAPSFAAKDINSNPNSNELIAGIPSEFPPYYLDEKGNYTGLAIDLFNEISSLAGINFTYVNKGSWLDVFQSMNDKNIDLIPNLGISAKRLKLYDFTQPIETFPISIFVRESSTKITNNLELAGHKVAMVKKNAAVPIMQSRTDFELLIYDNPRDALFALLSSEVDAFIFPKPVLLSLAQSIGVENQIKVVGETVLEVKRAIAIQKGNPELLKKLNLAIKQFIASPKYQQIYAKWHKSPKPYWTNMRVFLLTLGLFILFLVISITWRYFSLIKINKKLLSTLIQKNQAENHLRNSEARLKTLINTLPDLIWLKDHDGIYLACNQKFEAFYGHKEVDIIGKSDYDFVSKELADFFRKNDKAAEELGKARINEEQITFASDGHEEWIETIKAPMYEVNGDYIGVLGIGRDITKRKEDIHEIAILKERMELALLGSNGGLWDWDLISNEIYFSPQWKKLLGYSDNEFANEFSNWETQVYPDDLENAIADIQANINGQTDYYENTHRIKHKDGHWVWILDRGKTLYDDEGKAIRMTGTHTDISELKELQQELLDKEEIMLSQSRHAAMGEMIGMIAHQWRQPITVIAMGANNMLVDIELDAISESSVKLYAQSILKQTEHLSQTIEDFRNFFRPNKPMDEVSLEEVMDEAEKIIGKTLEHNNITLSIKYGNGHKVNTYSRELLQVYINLLNNAKEALLEHCLKERRIDIMFSDNTDSVITTICDNGGGIDDAIILKIFEPYFTTKAVSSGTGLGLYMSKTIVEKHLQGTMTVENTKHGVCFTILIPFQRKMDNV